MRSHPKDKITVTPPFLLIDTEIFDGKGRLLAKCYREDVAEILLSLLNSQPGLLVACENALPLIAGNRIAYDTFKPDNELEKDLADLTRKSEKELEVAIAKAAPNTKKKS
jgi:hypothetical protein